MSLTKEDDGRPKIFPFPFHFPLIKDSKTKKLKNPYFGPAREKFCRKREKFDEKGKNLMKREKLTINDS